MNFAIAIGATLLLGGFYSWTSRINGLFFFGRTVDPDLAGSDAGRTITRQYLTSIVSATGAAVLLAWLGSHFGVSALGLLAEVVAFSFLFARANRQVRTLESADASARGQVNPAPRREPVVQVALLEQPTYWIPGLFAILLPAMASLVVFGVVLLTSAHGASLAAGWNTLSNGLDAHGVDMPLGMGTGMLTAATVLLLVFRSSARLRTNMAQYTVRSSMVMEWVGAVLASASLACAQRGLTLTRNVGRGMGLVGVVAVLGTVVWNQARSKRFVPPSVELGADDRWCWGLFYRDRNDPALFVQSRCGAGYSLNYGRVLAWPITLALWAYFVAMLFVLPHYR